MRIDNAWVTLISVLYWHILSNRRLISYRVQQRLVLHCRSSRTSGGAPASVAVPPSPHSVYPRLSCIQRMSSCLHCAKTFLVFFFFKIPTRHRSETTQPVFNDIIKVRLLRQFLSSHWFNSTSKKKPLRVVPIWIQPNRFVISIAKNALLQGFFKKRAKNTFWYSGIFRRRWHKKCIIFWKWFRYYICIWAELARSKMSIFFWVVLQIQLVGNSVL